LWSLTLWGGWGGGGKVSVGWDKGTLAVSLTVGVGGGGGVEFEPTQQPTLSERPIDFLTHDPDGRFESDGFLSADYGVEAAAEFQVGVLSGQVAADVDVGVDTDGNLTIEGSATAAGSIGIGEAAVSGSGSVSAAIRSDLDDLIDPSNPPTAPISTQGNVEVGRTSYGLGAGGIAGERVQVRMRPSEAWDAVRNLFTGEDSNDADAPTDETDQGEGASDENEGSDPQEKEPMPFYPGRGFGPLL
jgi:hypothetical protein